MTNTKYIFKTAKDLTIGAVNLVTVGSLVKEVYGIIDGKIDVTSFDDVSKLLYLVPIVVIDSMLIIQMEKENKSLLDNKETNKRRENV